MKTERPYLIIKLVPKCPFLDMRPVQVSVVSHTKFLFIYLWGFLFFFTNHALQRWTIVLSRVLDVATGLYNIQ